MKSNKNTSNAPRAELPKKLVCEMTPKEYLEAVRRMQAELSERKSTKGKPR